MIDPLPFDRRYKSALRDMLHGICPNYWITFAFNRTLSLYRVEVLLSNWQARVDRSLVGPRWEKKPSKRTIYAGVAEHPCTNTHVHAVIFVPYKLDEFAEVATKHWSGLVPMGDLDIQKYRSIGAASYSAKDMRAQDSERIFLSQNIGDYGAHR